MHSPSLVSVCKARERPVILKLEKLIIFSYHGGGEIILICLNEQKGQDKARIQCLAHSGCRRARRRVP